MNSDKSLDTNPDLHSGYLLAAYKSIANNARANKHTRAILIFFAFVLIIVPLLFIAVITIAFLLYPTQTAQFFG